jgi:chemotaxis protein histidine kinase CheA
MDTTLKEFLDVSFDSLSQARALLVNREGRESLRTKELKQLARSFRTIRAGADFFELTRLEKSAARTERLLSTLVSRKPPVHDDFKRLLRLSLQEISLLLYKAGKSALKRAPKYSPMSMEIAKRRLGGDLEE